MTPGTLVLLHNPLDRAAAWGGVPEVLRSYGLDVVAPDIPSLRGAAYVARAALIIAATAPTTPLVLVGHGEAGPLLPLIGYAQRAAHRLVGAYVFIDARLPVSRAGMNGAAAGHAGQGHHGPHGESNGVPQREPGSGASGHGASGHGASRHGASGDGASGHGMSVGGTSPGASAAPGASAGPVAAAVPDPPADWPDAPCGFLATTTAFDEQVRQARLRGWSVARSDPLSGLAQAVHKLVVTL
jgi:hypothetical protein